MSPSSRSSASRASKGAKTVVRTTETPVKPKPRHGYTIDELARVAGSTVRNVRAYQDQIGRAHV
jgi:hypothetical protein